MPVQDGQKRTMIAVVGVTQHAADEAHVCELCEAAAAAISFQEDVLGFDVEAELRGGFDAFGDGRVEAMEAIEQEDLVAIELDRLAGGAASFLEAVHRFLDG